MGVTSLWSVLEDTCVKDVCCKELCGKTIAVDLSVWIVENKSSHFSHDYKNAYLRNLFHRVVYLLKKGVKLVCVVDGRAPDIKRAAMLKRQGDIYGDTAGVSADHINVDRPWFSSFVQKSCELLRCLGVPCITSHGEAEALCAQLNKTGIVDGCVTSDSDIFCYGARQAYRNFRQHNKDFYADLYTMDAVEKTLQLDQKGLIALALLIGCDYDKSGVNKVGKVTAMDLMRDFHRKKIDPLERICGWQKNKDLDETEALMMSPKKHESHCSKCQHLGNVTQHSKCGCHICDTRTDCLQSPKIVCPCQWHVDQRVVDEVKLEVKIRQKALKNKNFPNEQIIKEFLKGEEKINRESLKQEKPHLKDLEECMRNHLGWRRDTTRGYVVPALVHMQLRGEKCHQDELKPVRILKHRKENHEQCFEVEWKLKGQGSHIVTSPRVLFSLRYPILTREYESKLKKSIGRRKSSVPGGSRQTLLTQFTKVKKRLQFDDDFSNSTQTSKQCLDSGDSGVIEIIDLTHNTPCTSSLMDSSPLRGSSLRDSSVDLTEDSSSSEESVEDKEENRGFVGKLKSNFVPKFVNVKNKFDEMKNESVPSKTVRKARRGEQTKSLTNVQQRKRGNSNKPNMTNIKKRKLNEAGETSQQNTACFFVTRKL